jgi:hypothetical protein
MAQMTRFSPSSHVTATSGRWVIDNLPLGPSTETVRLCGSIVTRTPLGTLTGFFPILDMF